MGSVHRKCEAYECSQTGILCLYINIVQNTCKSMCDYVTSGKVNRYFKMFPVYLSQDLSDTLSVKILVGDVKPELSHILHSVSWEYHNDDLD